jgi:cysteine desulfurase/selenocysteine lyase
MLSIQTQTLSRPESKTAPLDIAQIRRDFPIFTNPVHTKPLVFLDNAASSQKPLQVLEAMEQIYRSHYANVHRGVYAHSEYCTEQYDQARRRVAGFIGAPSPEQIIFTRNATEALNLVAYAYSRRALKSGDTIILTELEHHANLVPWMMLAKERELHVRFIPITADGVLDLAALEQMLTPEVKLVCCTHMSNVLGTVTDARLVIAKAHAVGAKVVLDACQSVPHMPVDVQDLGCDFLAFSGHKMLGPTGIGVLYGRRALLDAMPPFLTGGGMISTVTFDDVTWAELPLKFEAGTPAFVEAIGLGAAIDYLTTLGMSNIQAHEQQLTRYAQARLQTIPDLTLIGPDDQANQGPIVAFTIDGIHPHDLATLLDQEGVAIRAGHHCAQPLHMRLGLQATARASFSIYNDWHDVDALATAIGKARRVLHRKEHVHG